MPRPKNPVIRGASPACPPCSCLLTFQRPPSPVAVSTRQVTARRLCRLVSMLLRSLVGTLGLAPSHVSKLRLLDSLSACWARGVDGSWANDSYTEQAGGRGPPASREKRARRFFRRPVAVPRLYLVATQKPASAMRSMVSGLSSMRPNARSLEDTQLVTHCDGHPTPGPKCASSRVSTGGA